MNSKQRQRRARVMKLAEDYRRGCVGDGDIFPAMENLDFELSKRDDILISSRDEIYDRAMSVPARVRFYKSGRMHLEYSERTGRGALAGLPMDVFAICHEIAHVNLHRRKMKTKIDGAGRNLTTSMQGIHPETQEIEEEAHIYGGLLMIPLSRITVDADFMDLACEYNTPPNVAKQLRWDVLEVWIELKRLEKDK